MPVPGYFSVQGGTYLFMGICIGIYISIYMYVYIFIYIRSYTYPFVEVIYPYIIGVRGGWGFPCQTR